MDQKPTYKVSATIVNSYLYYKQFPSDQSKQSFEDTLNKVFKSNKWTERGNRFEQEVFEGKHGKLSQLVSKLPKQQWGNKTLEFPEFKIFLSGKLDVFDPTKKRIYDIKRTDVFKEATYNNSVQHLFYLYLFPDVTNFYYLVAEGPDDTITDIHIVDKPRPEALEDTVKKVITDFIDFLKENNYWETFTQKHSIRKNRKNAE